MAATPRRVCSGSGNSSVETSFRSPATGRSNTKDKLRAFCAGPVSQPWLVCFIRLFDSLVTLLQSRRSRHGEATRPCPLATSYASPLLVRACRRHAWRWRTLAQPIRVEPSGVATRRPARCPLATSCVPVAQARGPLPHSVRFVRQQIVSALPVRPRSDRDQLSSVNSGPILTTGASIYWSVEHRG